MIRSLCLAAMALAYATPLTAQVVGGVELIELTIGAAHEAMLARTLTARQLVVAYLKRIDAYDKRGPSFNALIMVNSRALDRADELDAALLLSGIAISE